MAGEQTANTQSNKNFWLHTFPKILDYIVIVLAFGLIVFISWYTYKGVDYLMNNAYMTYQFAVCIFFIMDFFYRLIITHHRIRFFIICFPFLLISIPYLNLIEYFDLNVGKEALHLLCSVPIFRGLIALMMVVNYVAKTLSTTLCASYVLVLFPIVYMSGLLFYVAEKDINIAVKNFWYAMWWAGMNVTTIGCNINPVTSTGMVIGFILSLLGITMLPLFTVYLGNAVQNYNKKVKSDKTPLFFN